jgi:dethiobiotin synthase
MCSSAHRIIFVTGTDTGVGKTVLTALLLACLRNENMPAYALKPFCCGDRGDAKLLFALQDGDLKLDEINPFFFSKPLAPVVAPLGRSDVPLRTVLAHIRSLCSKLRPSSHLLIEGVGGLLVPLGKGYSVLDFISALSCEVIVVSANKLGTINHTMLTAATLRHPQNRFPAGNIPVRGLRKPSRSKFSFSKVVLMDSGKNDLSSKSNPLILRDLLKPIPCISVPYLGVKAAAVPVIQSNAKKFKKTLARILD